MACAQQVPAKVPVARSLPPVESVVPGPVAVPPIAAGDDARVALAKTRAALGTANARLRSGRGIYARVRRTYQAGK